MFNLLDTLNPLKGNFKPKYFADGDGGGDGGNKTWQEALPDDIKADVTLAKYKEPADAHRALVDAQKFLGREKLPVPIDANDNETHTIIAKRLGMPDSVDGYKLPTDLDIPKDLPLDEALVTDFKKVAHESRLLPAQVNALYKWFIETQATAFNKFGEDKLAAGKAAETELRKETGAAYNQTIDLAQKVISTYGDDNVKSLLEEGAGNNLPLIKMFASIGKILSEDQLVGKPKTLEMTPSEAQSELNKIQGDLKGPLYDDAHPQHKEAVARVDTLTRLTMGNK